MGMLAKCSAKFKKIVSLDKVIILILESTSYYL